ncbi:MAG: hypothetical protein NTV25_03545 [Methanothrix sp.]|nr:hypothetical protein [Methanothrix sp.]
MPDEIKTCGGDMAEPHLEDQVILGKKLPKELIEDLKGKGWLDENGICHFPTKVSAYPTGWQSILSADILFKATVTEIWAYIDKGWITFADGNGDYYTLTKYNEKYPNYPDPLMLMVMQGRFPPKPGSIIQLGGKYDRPGIVRLGGNGTRHTK